MKMQIKSTNSTYNLIQFYLYISREDSLTYDLELYLDCTIDDFNEDDFTSLFVIETGQQDYVFSGYEVSEYYEENGLLKVICVK